MNSKYSVIQILSIVVFSLALSADFASAADKDIKTSNKNIAKQNYSLEQAMSDKAQLHTIAFSGLAFLTGDFGASTFIPPGKVADYFGFQYMRDIDAAQKGHNPLFLNRVAGNVLKTLTTEQKALFVALAQEQAPQLIQLAQMRLPMIAAFHKAADNQMPEGMNGLSKTEVVSQVADIFELDALLSMRRAEVMAEVARSLSAEQQAFFDSMTFGDFSSWPDITKADQQRQKADTRGQDKMVNVAYMTYASEFFSWLAGSELADVYFCPERHGTYFGGFYMKDMPAMGQGDYDISLEITGDSGEGFLSILTDSQRADVARIIEIQKPLLTEIEQVRRDMSVQLRRYLSGDQPSEELVRTLGRRYGELDGGMSYLYASAFARIAQNLSDDQHQALIELRNLPGYTSAPYYLYSQAMITAPELSQTAVDRFFSKQSEEPVL